MSGIVAVVNFDGEPVDPEVLRMMAEQCAYRGPGGIRYWIRGNVGMAHLALHSTPEALREIQPQLSADGSLCLTADVRVDNRPELIALLQAKGQPVNNDSTDADLVLAAYQVWGEHCPEQIIGDYAFAIWDAREQRLFCARDIYGVKSLHYTRVGSLLCVASEAQQIIQHPKVPRILDEIAVADFLTANLNDEGRTMFQGVWAVHRAYCLTSNSTGQQMRRYWDIDPNNRITYKNNEDYASHFLEIFQRVIADHIRTDGRVIGITMSGGMDSTSIAAIAQRLLTSQPGQSHLLACSNAFEQFKESDEAYYSQAMRKELGIDLVYIQAENFWLLDDKEAFTPSLETPLMAGESLTRHTLEIFKEHGAHVLLTGHGGDNLLKGSTLIYFERLLHGELKSLLEVADFYKHSNLPLSDMLSTYRIWFLRPLIPDGIRKLIRKTEGPQIPDWLNTEFARRTQIVDRQSTENTPKIYSELSRQENYGGAIHTNILQMALSRLERLGAQFQIEARHPFLDRRLAEFVLAIPPEQLYKIGWGKLILRRAMRGILPEIIRTRPDKTITTRYFNLGPKYKEVDTIRELLTVPLQSKLHLVESNKLKSTYERYLVDEGSRELRKFWQSVSLELWLKAYYQDFLL